MILGIADAVNGVPIRLTDERWEHILDSHPELVSVGARHRQSEYRQQLSFFERVEADEFIFTDAGGGVTTKKQDLEGLKQPANPDVKLIAYDVDEMNVLLYDKMAVVTGRVTTKRMVKGAEVVSKSRFTDVFVWRQERWQLVAG